jgi:hypothetical protein
MAHGDTAISNEPLATKAQLPFVTRNTKKLGFCALCDASAPRGGSQKSKVTHSKVLSLLATFERSTFLLAL